MAKGRSDGRTVIIVPEVKDNETTGLTLLHVRFADDLPLAVAARRCCRATGAATAPSSDAVTETEPTFRDDLLVDVPVVDLLTEPVNDLADRWRS